MKIKHTRLEDVIWSPYNGQATWNQTRLDVLDSIQIGILAKHPRMYTQSYSKLTWLIISNINWATSQPRRFVRDDLQIDNSEYDYEI